MGLDNSKFEKDIRTQESYVSKRMKDPDIAKLKNCRGSLWGHDTRKYNDMQIKGYLRQEFNNTRKSNSYISDQDLRHAGVSAKRHR